jgi:hypothetical protein
MIESSYFVGSAVSIDTTLHVTRPLFTEPGATPRGWLARLHLGVVARF